MHRRPGGKTRRRAVPNAVPMGGPASPTFSAPLPCDEE